MLIIPDKKCWLNHSAIAIFDNANKSSRAKITAFTVEEDNALTDVQAMIANFAFYK